MSLAHWPARSLEHFLMSPMGSPTHPFTNYWKVNVSILLYSSTPCGRYFWCLVLSIFSFPPAHMEDCTSCDPCILARFFQTTTMKKPRCFSTFPFLMLMGPVTIKVVKMLSNWVPKDQCGAETSHLWSCPYLIYVLRDFVCVKNNLFWKIKSLLFWGSLSTSSAI